MAKFVLCIVMFAVVVVAHKRHPKFPKSEEYSIPHPLSGIKGEYRKGEYCHRMLVFALGACDDNDATTAVLEWYTIDSDNFADLDILLLFSFWKLLAENQN